MRAYLIFSSVLLVALSLSPRAAHAQSTCSANSDCLKGWTCEVTGGGACTSPACAPGEKCEPIDCVNVEIKSCRPGPCTADSDCASGMVCYKHTETNCAPSACAPGQECPTPDCAPKTESACVPRYLLPCTTASDCGAGFTCETSGEQCTCSGSSGSSGGSGDANGGAPPSPPPPPTESCTCEPSKDLSCRAPKVDCVADADCAVGWSCAVVSSTSDCGSAPAPNPTPGAGAQGGANPVPDCKPSADVKQCVPPYYALVQGIKGVERDSSDSAGSPTLGVGAGDAQESPALPPTAESGNANDTSSAGCSVGHSSPRGSVLALFGLLGLFGASRRRRAR